MPTVSNDPLEGRSESCHCHEVFIAGCQAVLPWAEARGIAIAANTRDKNKMRGSACFIKFLLQIVLDEEARGKLDSKVT
jgi:hypothetical protein